MDKLKLELQGLKAHAYDTIALIELKQSELQSLNNEILQLSQKMQKNQDSK